MESSTRNAFVSPFPEDKFPCSTEEYDDTIHEGLRVANHLSVAICLCCRDVGRRLENTIDYVEATRALFGDSTVCVFENDSKDDTRDRLLTWANARGRVFPMFRDLGRRKWGMVRNPDRGTEMAEYRNECRTMVFAVAGHADLVIVVDADLAGWSLEGILHSVGLWNWDVAASNGLRRDGSRYVQADAWAFRQTTWRALPFGKVKNVLPDRGDEPIELNSAFGGMAIYKMPAFRSADYGGGDCEHVVFHRRMAEAGHDNLVLNPSQIAAYRL